MSVGQSLTEARVASGLSVDDVSAATRIRGSLIREIEADDFHGCGGDVYARGHIRSIARVVGTDPEPLLTEYDRDHRIEVPVVTTAPLQTDPAELARTERRGPNWTAAMVVALLVIIAAATYGLVSRNDAKSPTAGKNPGTSITNPPSTAQSPSPPSSSDLAQLPNNKAVMLVRVQTAETWIQVSNATGGLFEGDLMPGQHKLFSSKSALTFVIGNAPAVDLVINGKDIGSPQSSGSVARGRVLPGSSTIQQA